MNRSLLFILLSICFTGCVRDDGAIENPIAFNISVNKGTPFYVQSPFWVFISDRTGRVLTEKVFGTTSLSLSGIADVNDQIDLTLYYQTNRTDPSTNLPKISHQFLTYTNVSHQAELNLTNTPFVFYSQNYFTISGVNAVDSIATTNSVQNQTHENGILKFNTSSTFLALKGNGESHFREYIKPLGAPPVDTINLHFDSLSIVLEQAMVNLPNSDRWSHTIGVVKSETDLSANTSDVTLSQVTLLGSLIAGLSDQITMPFDPKNTDPLYYFMHFANFDLNETNRFLRTTSMFPFSLNDPGIHFELNTSTPLVVNITDPGNTLMYKVISRDELSANHSVTWTMYGDSHVTSKLTYPPMPAGLLKELGDVNPTPRNPITNIEGMYFEHIDSYHEALENIFSGVYRWEYKAGMTSLSKSF